MGKALVGMESSEAPREVSFCARTIVQEEGMLVVPDTRNDPEWAENDMVTGDGGLRFYAGAAIVNDEFGHHVGDRLLALVAERLAGAARAGDLVARFGGDEFAVLCPQLSCAEDLPVIARRLHEQVAVPAILDGVELTPACSFGGALAGDADDVESLLRRADAEMYESKRARRAAAFSSPRAS